MQRLDHQQREQCATNPENRPSGTEIRHQCRQKRPVTQRRGQPHRSAVVLVGDIQQRGAPQSEIDQHDNDHQRSRVDDKGRRKAQPHNSTAQCRPGYHPQQETRTVQPLGSSPNLLRRNAHQQRRRGHGEHGRTDPADRAKHQQLPIAMHEGADTGRCGDDQQSAHVDPALPQPLHQCAGHGCEHQPEGRERTHHRSRRGHAHPEAAGVLGQRGRHHAEPERDHQACDDQNPDLPRQAWLYRRVVCVSFATATQPMTAETTSLAASCTWFKCSAPRNDSA